MYFQNMNINRFHGAAHKAEKKKPRTKKTNPFLFLFCLTISNFSPVYDKPKVHICFSYMCFPVRKKSGRSSLALAVWNSSLSLNLHSSSSSNLPTVSLSELRSALMTHRVAPKASREEGERHSLTTVTQSKK